MAVSRSAEAEINYPKQEKDGLVCVTRIKANGDIVRSMKDKEETTIPTDGAIDQ